MPSITRVFTLEVTPEKFIDNCSAVELQEVFLLANARLNRETPPPIPHHKERELAHHSVTKPEPAALPAKNSRKKISEKNYFWTLEDEALLRKLYSSTKVKDLAEMLHRSMNAIALRANLLGIRKYQSKAKPLCENTVTVRKTTEKRHDESLQEEVGNRRERAIAALNTAKQQEDVKAMRSLRIDARTTVLVPADTDDAKYIKNYKKKMGL